MTVALGLATAGRLCTMFHKQPAQPVIEYIIWPGLLTPSLHNNPRSFVCNLHMRLSFVAGCLYLKRLCFMVVLVVLHSSAPFADEKGAKPENEQSTTTLGFSPTPGALSSFLVVLCFESTAKAFYV